MKIGYIYDREFNSSFHSLYGYVFTAFMLLVAGIYFCNNRCNFFLCCKF